MKKLFIRFLIKNGKADWIFKTHYRYIFEIDFIKPRTLKELMDAGPASIWVSDNKTKNISNASLRRLDMKWQRCRKRYCLNKKRHVRTVH